MASQLVAGSAREALLAETRRRFFEEGQLPEGEIPRAVLQSWLRCRDAGLEREPSGRGDPEGRAALADARERSSVLLNNASGIMEHVFEQIRASGSMVILADDRGMILHSLGDPEFIDRAQRVSLQPGASWSEEARGTNAIGTTLVEHSPVEVLGSEHFLARNAILSCSAAPVFAPDGSVAGVLDISGDSRNNQRHTLGLVRIAVQLLEKRLFELQYSKEFIVAFHVRPECVGGPQEGLIALNPEGRVVGANASARSVLKKLPAELDNVDFAQLARITFGSFMDRCARDPYALQALDMRCGLQVYARLRGGMPLTSFHRASEAEPAAIDTSAATGRSRRSKAAEGEVTLKCLATGDERLQLALDRAARIMGKDIPLLILGESGVGKELFARAFHFSGPRAEGPFVALNCAAIPENLIESELFGYVGGAFTGARREGAVGKVQQAHGGTLFLDEIGDMPLSMQARLLRVLQERQVVPVGGGRPIPVDISLVCATHRVLRESVRSGEFREDLYYRVNGLTVTLPPLRERSDIRSIVIRLLERELRGSPQAELVTISEQVLEFFERYPWPGNIRQLQNVIRVATALLDDDETEILPVHLPEELFGVDPMDDVVNGKTGGQRILSTAQAAAASPVAPTGAGARSLDEIELEVIANVMREVGGNVSAAARRLGISRNTLYRKIGRMN
jgi:transcriptional regulator of acetoin/glycerol metabolism